ncbi:TPM domain-containing protein [Candidatus Shapirobacteria bacterium]|nr:TPM domain-containing protein [Candidatus Shapirobacteria bacterium]
MFKRLFVGLGFFLIPFLFFLFKAQALEFPQPTGYVNDWAQLLSGQVKESLEQRLSQFEQESTVEIAVVTITSLGENSIEDYAVRLFEDWQIGKKGKDNGVLLLIALEERELRIEVGYGLEPVLTDSKAGRIIRETITPEFKKGNFEKGILDGVEEIIGNLKGETEANKDSLPQFRFDSGPFWILFVILILFLSYSSSFLARSKRFWPGGVLGAVLGLLFGWLLFKAFLLAFGTGFAFGALGLIFDWWLSKNYKIRKKKGLPTSWWKSGGGFSSGGFGGRSSGGFGGFGGGSSGGGGASGSW